MNQDEYNNIINKLDDLVTLKGIKWNAINLYSYNNKN